MKKSHYRIESKVDGIQQNPLVEVTDDHERMQELFGMLRKSPLCSDVMMIVITPAMKGGSIEPELC
jgi:hypothetical protein